MWFIAVEVEQETSAPPPKKNPGFAPALYKQILRERFQAIYLLLVATAANMQ